MLLLVRTEEVEECNTEYQTQCSLSYFTEEVEECNTVSDVKYETQYETQCTAVQQTVCQGNSGHQPSYGETVRRDGQFEVFSQSAQSTYVSPTFSQSSSSSPSSSSTSGFSYPPITSILSSTAPVYTPEGNSASSGYNAPSSSGNSPSVSDNSQYRSPLSGNSASLGYNAPSSSSNSPSDSQYGAPLSPVVTNSQDNYAGNSVSTNSNSESEEYGAPVAAPISNDQSSHVNGVGGGGGCQQVPRESCNSVPRTVPINVPRQQCQTVEKQVPRYEITLSVFCFKFSS